MEDAKKSRTKKARTVTRRVHELENAIRVMAPKREINEKIEKLKSTQDELGEIQDTLLDALENEGYAHEIYENTKWYEKYDETVMTTISAAREYLDSTERPQLTTATDNLPSSSQHVKLQKLRIPCFESRPRQYLKWKETFERYTVDLSHDIKYDYLLESTKGEAHNFVENCTNYLDAILQLDKQFGNKHLIMTLLIDDVKSLPYVRKGDFKGFEKLSYEANKFRNRLIEMGEEAQVENTYILKEIESKLNYDDLQKWLESTGDVVNERRVEDIALWLEKQTNLRRIAHLTCRKTSFSSNPYHNNVGVVGHTSVCALCRTDTHNISDCVKFLSLSHNEKWNSVKQYRLCFICLREDHNRSECSGKKCTDCQGPHHTILHNPSRRKNIQDNSNYSVSICCTKEEDKTEIMNSKVNYSTEKNEVNLLTQGDQIKRVMLPVVNSTLINGNIRIKSKTLIDGGSEIHIMTSKLCNRLGLKGIPLNIKLVGVGRAVTHKRVQKVEVTIEDRSGKQTLIECIVLENACGKTIEIDNDTRAYIEKEMSLPRSKLVNSEGDVELLLGMATPQLHSQLSVRRHSCGVELIETRFGPCLVGQIPNQKDGNYICGNFTSGTVVGKLDYSTN